jgi:RNA polymerase sigma-70 factor, ECF subfamily
MAATTELAKAANEDGPTGAEVRAELFERILGRVHRYFGRAVADPHQAEECAQETLLALERSLREGRYDAGRSFNTWIFMKAHQTFVDWCRRREREARPLDALARGPSDDPRPAVERRLDGRALLAAVEAELGAETLETFVLRYEAGLTLDEVAEATGCERRTVSRRLARAHELIDGLLGRAS